MTTCDGKLHEEWSDDDRCEATAHWLLVSGGRFRVSCDNHMAQIASRLMTGPDARLEVVKI